VTGIRRVIVGASGSPASLQALRYAEELARANDALLIPVLAWVPPGGDLADRRAPCGYLRRVWAEDADHRLKETLSVVLGEIPAGHPPVRPLVQRGEAGLVLVNTACYPDDLLVVGAGCRGALTRAVSGKVYHYCVAHAHCPVVTVPPPDFARELRRGPLTWMFWHRPLTPDQVLQDRAMLQEPGQHRTAVTHCGSSRRVVPPEKTRPVIRAAAVRRFAEPPGRSPTCDMARAGLRSTFGW